MPLWLTEEDHRQIAKLYAEAKRLTETTETIYNVDHEVPLQGKSVSGLHVPENLRVITHFENASKHNKFDEEVISQKYFDWLKSRGL